MLSEKRERESDRPSRKYNKSTRRKPCASIHTCMTVCVCVCVRASLNLSDPDKREESILSCSIFFPISPPKKQTPSTNIFLLLCYFCSCSQKLKHIFLRGPKVLMSAGARGQKAHLLSQYSSLTHTHRCVFFSADTSKATPFNQQMMVIPICCVFDPEPDIIIRKYLCVLFSLVKVSFHR